MSKGESRNQGISESRSNVTEIPRLRDSEILLKVEKMEKTFAQAGESLTILQNLSMALDKGEMVALVGPSGSGKSTLLHMVGLLDTPTAGRIVIAGHETSRMNDAERTKLRRDTIGFVYQFHYLQPEFSALENVALPQIIAGKKKKDANAHAEELLKSLGLSHRLTHRPARLSGGEQQRVAIARALANNPQLLLADEPTGNLDAQTSAEVFEILLDLVRQRGIGALIATHNIDLAEQMDRILEVKNGRLLGF
jgi:lipoprotein-releasing system ATP-binding protein